MSDLSYTEAREVIQDGDIVFVHGLWRRPLQALIMFFTGSKFSHCCIAFWIETRSGKRLLCVEAQGQTRRRILSLSYYDDHRLTVVAAPKKWEEVENIALAQVGKARYGMLEAIYVGVREFVERNLGVSLPMMDLPHEICSEFCARVYNLRETAVSPQLLYEELMKVTVER